MTIQSPRDRLLLAISLVLSTLLFSIDSTIVNVALPHIQGSLQATQDQAAWIATAYMVVGAVFTPLTGWLGLRFGLRPVLLASVVGFTVCSVLCGVATSLAQMVLFRALQGAFGAALIPLAQVTFLQDFPRASYARLTSIWATAALVGPIIGPTLGGYLTDSFSWRWAFYINLPIGILAWLGISAAMPRVHGRSKKPFDLPGFVLLSLAIGLVQLMLDRGQTEDWFHSAEIVAEAFFAALFLWMYVAHAWFHKHAFVDLQLFRDRNFSMCTLTQGLVGAFVMSPSVLLPTFLQQLQGYTPAQAGRLMAARGAASMLAMFISGRYASRINGKLSMILGTLLISGTLAMVAQFSVDTPPSLIVLSGILLGIGMPMTYIPTQLIAFATLPDALRTEAGVILRLAVGIGGSIGISLSVAELARSAQTNQAYLGEFFTPYALDRWIAVGGPPGTNPATALLLAEVQRQALSIAYANVYFALACAALSSIPVILWMRNTNQALAMATSEQIGHSAG